MHYDVVVLGAGIAGAGVAQAASAAGYKVLVLEKGEVGAQTSSCSSKLIHGGLRYLESGQLSLVYSALKERRALLKLAPKLVEPIPFYLPVYSYSQRGKCWLTAGLSLYKLLALGDPLANFTQVPKSQWSNIAGLKQENLQALFQYWDAHTDDQKLTQAVMKSAQQLGAKLVTQACFINAKLLAKHPSCYEINYLNQQDSRQQNVNNEQKLTTVTASVVVNATGPWVNDVLTACQPAVPTLAIEWLQGCHIVLDVPALPHVFYLESIVDQRVVFVMPWQGKTMVGTTETPLQQLPDKIMPYDDEINYLLNIYQHYFAKDKVTSTQENNTHLPKILAAFAGVRVLPKSTSSAFNRQRESIIYQHPSQPQIFTLYGGKLTTFRATSKKVVNKITRLLGTRKAIADIDKLMLT